MARTSKVCTLSTFRTSVVAALLLCGVGGAMLCPGAASAGGFRLYGYFDMETEVDAPSGGAEIWTFDQHHLNFLAIYTIDDRFRVLTEVEYEHGPFHGNDPTGAIYLPKAILEFKPSDAFKVSAGNFLPPFGIYNERHDATVTFVSTVIPQSIYGKRPNAAGEKERVFAKLGTGVRVDGRLRSGDWEFGYGAYAVNGHGPEPAESDNNADKGLGGRMSVSPPVEGLSLGASFYREKNGNAFGARQSVLAGDLSYESERVLIETEIMWPRFERVDASNEPDGSFRNALGFYVQGALAIADHVRPFARFDRYDSDVDSGDTCESHYVYGINFPVTPAVYLKVEAHHVEFEDPAVRNYRKFISSVAVAF